jgi:hypothetical protein
MFASFKYDALPLKDIMLDVRNPRIVTQSVLSTQEEILQYLFDYEGLFGFIAKIADEGRNKGAERPYVVKTGNTYTVIEGNSRIAAYKVLSGLMVPPSEYAGSVSKVTTALAKSLLTVECTIAPSRDALLPIMANAHFGLGDKSKWGYLGSRKAVYDEWKGGKTIAQLAKVFDREEGQIRELINEFLLYRETLNLTWSKAERTALEKPSVKFNPPVRFLQTKGHQDKIGIKYGSPDPAIIFASAEAKKKLKHLVKKLVVSPAKGLGATASYDDVFADYGSKGASPSAGSASGGAAAGTGGAGAASGTGAGGGSPGGGSGSGAGTATSGAPTLKPGALFAYPVSVNNNLISALMKEAKGLNCKAFPAAGTFLLRNVVEAVLKNIIYDQKANPASNYLDLEGSLNLCVSAKVTLPAEDRKVLKEFHKSHLAYLNLGAHGNVVPNYDRMVSARDCIDLFIKRNV